MWRLGGRDFELEHPANGLWRHGLSAYIRQVSTSECFMGLFSASSRGEAVMNGAHGRSCVVASAVIGQIVVFYAALKFIDLAIPKFTCQRVAPQPGHPESQVRGCFCQKGLHDLSYLTKTFWNPLLGKEDLGLSSLDGVRGDATGWAVSESRALEAVEILMQAGRSGALAPSNPKVASALKMLFLPPLDLSTLMDLSEGCSPGAKTSLRITDKVMIATSLYLKQFVDQHFSVKTFGGGDVVQALKLLKIMRGSFEPLGPNDACAELSYWSIACAKETAESLRNPLSESDYYTLSRSPYWKAWSYTRAPQLKVMYAHSREAHERCRARLMLQHPAEIAVFILEHEEAIASNARVGEHPKLAPSEIPAWFNQLCGGLPNRELGPSWGRQWAPPMTRRG